MIDSRIDTELYCEWLTYALDHEFVKSPKEKYQKRKTLLNIYFYNL